MSERENHLKKEQEARDKKNNKRGNHGQRK